MKTIDILFTMLDDIAARKNTDKKGMLEKCISQRLNKSLKTYYDSLDYSATYLQHINNPTRQKKILEESNGHKEE